MARPVPAAVAAVLVLGTWAALALSVRRDGVSRRPTGGPTPARARRPVPAPPPVRLTPFGRAVALGTAVLVPVVVLAVLNSSSGFVWDDLKNLRQAQVARLSWDYLLEPTSGHFAPGHRLGDWIQQRAFGFKFPPAQAQLLIGFALSLVLFHRILVELFHAGPGAYLLTLAFGVSMVHVGVTQWWASGLDRVPATILSFFSIWAYLRWHGSRAWPWLASSIAAVAVGLLFYIKPAFVPAYLVLITILLLHPGRPVGESLAATLKDWWVWAIYAGVTGVLGGIYVSMYPTELNQDGGLGVALRYLGVVWSRVFVPNLFGLFVPKGDLAPSMVLATVLTHLLLAGVVGWTVLRWRGAWRAWAFFAAGFVLNVVVVGLTRVGASSVEIVAYTTYFNLEAVVLFFLALAAAVLGRPAGAERPATVPRGAPAAGLAAYVALSVWGGWRLSVPENWIGARARPVLDRAEAELARLHRSGADVALVDGVFPYYVMPYLLVPYNSTSEIVPLFDPESRFDAGAGELFHLDRRGVARAVTFRWAEGGGASDLLRTGRFGVVGAVDARFEGERFCLVAGRDAVTLGLQLPLPIDDEDGSLALLLEFEAERPSVLSLVVHPLPKSTDALAGGRDQFRVVNTAGRTGVQRRVYALDAPEAETVLVVVAARSELCLHRFEVGHLVRR